MRLKTEYLGYPIECRTDFLDDGLHVLLTGGCRTHIGALSVAEPDGSSRTMTFPGHKDQFVSKPWAEQLARKAETRVCVVCGIHYDHATRDEIQGILHKTDELLAQLLEHLA